MENKNETFSYTYSAKQQEEVKRIRQKYLTTEENKMEQLRKLDKQAEKPGTVRSLIIGTIGSLLLGLGMCCTMVWTNLFVPGVIIGLASIALVAIAYPVFVYTTRKQRDKLAPEIMRISDELMHQQ